MLTKFSTFCRRFLGSGPVATAVGHGCGKSPCKGSLTRLRLRITVCHFPPGTSKWNKIKHRMFCHITENWREAAGQPSRRGELDREYKDQDRTEDQRRTRTRLPIRRGLKVTDEEFATIKITKSEFHGDWNYTILPR